MKLIAREYCSYNGRWLAQGQAFEPNNDKDGEMLILIGKALIAGDDVPIKRGPGRPRKYERRDMVVKQ